MWEREFLLNGGEKIWLEGIDHLPRKLGNLLEVLGLLCHQPWLINREHISVRAKRTNLCLHVELICDFLFLFGVCVGKKKALSRGEDGWSIAELVHAMVIICTFGSLSRIVFGCGITPEVDLDETEVKTAKLTASEDTEEEEGAAFHTSMRRIEDIDFVSFFPFCVHNTHNSSQ
jgi:sestrin